MRSGMGEVSCTRMNYARHLYAQKASTNVAEIIASIMWAIDAFFDHQL